MVEKDCRRVNLKKLTSNNLSVFCVVDSSVESVLGIENSVSHVRHLPDFGDAANAAHDT